MRIFRRLGAVALLLSTCIAIGCSGDVKIGAVVSKTGGVSPYGRQITRGLDLALAEINAAGGFKGGEIELIYRDDATNRETGKQVVRDLIDNEGIKLIIGAISSSVTMSIAPICEKKRALLLSPSASAPSISELGEYIFRNYPSDILEGTAMADFARKLGMRRVVIIALDDEFGAGLTEVFSRQFESKSRQILETFRIKEGDTDAFDGIVEQLQELNPQGIYIVAYEDTVVDLLRRLRAAGVKAQMLGSAAVTEQLPAKAGDSADLFVYPQPSFDPQSADRSVAAFVEAYTARYDEPPDIYAAHGYDALKLLWQAMNDTGSAHPDEVRRGLLTLKGYKGAAGHTAFDERGDVVRYPTIFIIRDGKSITFEQFEKEGGQLS